MSDQLYEQISAFADGELPENETELLLKRLEREPELRAALVRYHVIGANVRETATRTTILRGGSRSFVARVNAAIAADGARPATGARVRMPRWLKPVAGVAIAATVAAVAILGVQWIQLPLQENTVAAVTPVNPVASPLVIGDVQVTAPSYTVPVPTTDTPIVPAARLTNYVVAHSQYSSALGRRNVLSGIISEDPTPLDESGKPLEGAQPAPVPAADQP